MLVRVPQACNVGRHGSCQPLMMLAPLGAIAGTRSDLGIRPSLALPAVMGVLGEDRGRCCVVFCGLTHWCSVRTGVLTSCVRLSGH